MRTFSDKVDVELARYTLGGSRLDDKWCLGGQPAIPTSGTASIRTGDNANTHRNQLKDNGVSERFTCPDYRRTTSVTAMLEKLQWDSLQQR